MKRLALIALCLPALAQASYYQTYCSNADGTTRYAHGHSDHFLTVTERAWTEEGPKRIVVELEDASIDLSDEKELVSESKQNCGESGFGVGSWRSVSYVKARITKDDGSLFSEDTVGVSKDLKSIEADMICENNGNSMMMCEKPGDQTK